MREGIGFLADPIHGITEITVSVKREFSERDIVDSPWVQRLRQIHQLQSAWWVYPSGEHTRFQHSMGVMHLAGRFMEYLYPSLKRSFKNVPEKSYLIELMRIAGLLHDIGHGPFGHFFDQEYLSLFNINHEVISQKIIVEELGDIIKRIRRSPEGRFKKKINPEFVAFLIKKPEDGEVKRYPDWLKALRPLFSGIYTVDNMDFVLRDSYMCGIPIPPVEIERLMKYTFFTRDGLTIHKNGLSSLKFFLSARQFLFENVYFHRTTRSIDLQMKEIFRDTLSIIFPYNPLENLKKYMELTEWSLFAEIRNWKNEKGKKRELYLSWQDIFNRKLKWREIYDEDIEIEENIPVVSLPRMEAIEDRIRKRIEVERLKYAFHVDLPILSPRPDNPLKIREKLRIYSPAGVERYHEITELFPAYKVKFRVFVDREKVKRKRDENIIIDAVKIVRNEGLFKEETNV